MYAIARILSYDGHAGLSSPSESMRPKHSRAEMYETGGWEEKPNSFLNSLFWSLSLRENKPSSSGHVNRNPQHGFNTVQTEVASMHTQQNIKQRNPKAANNGDSGKKKEKMYVNHTNGIHQPEAASIAKQSKHKSANSLSLGNKKENMPSDQVYGNQQPNSAPREAASPVAKHQISKKTKNRPANNSDFGKKKTQYVPKIDLHKKEREGKVEQKGNA